MTMPRVQTKTKVINLFSGSGTGKSTVAAALFAELKRRSVNCELAREYIKEWAYENRTPGKFDQIYIFGNQARAEGHLYEKVEVLITDSPLLLVPFYEHHLIKKSIVEPAVFNFIKYAEEHGVTYHNFWLERLDTFDTRGRFETVEQAMDVDVKMKAWLTERNIPLIPLPKDHDQRLKIILNHLGFEYPLPSQTPKSE